MKSFNLICIWLFGSLTILIANEAREWESSDGKILKAEFVSANERIVTIRRTSDGRRFTIPLDRISEKDRDWVKEKLEEIKGPGKKEPSGIFRPAQ